LNKKVLVLILIVLFIPALISVGWYLSVSGDTFTPSNVAVVRLITPDGETLEYTSKEEKEFFTTLSSNLVHIEKQTFSSDIWSLYTLEFEQTFDIASYYLCLSGDAKNCLAYDEKGNWYRIHTEDAKKFLVRKELEGIYTNSTYPQLSVSQSGNLYNVSAKEYEWNYLLADGTFAHISDKSDMISESIVTISQSLGFSVSFSVQPDWCDVKIFSDDTLLFSGDISSLDNFQHSQDCTLRALVTANWYQDESKLYYGSTVTEFYFDYDVRATAQLNKDTFIPGEIAYVKLFNATGDKFTVNSDLDTAEELSIRRFGDFSYLAVPISINNKTGSYSIRLTSENSDINLSLNITERLIEDAKMKLASATAYEYQSALENFVSEIQIDDYNSRISEPLWKDGFVTPVIKFKEGKESYWISAPPFAAAQIVDGMKLSVKNFGTHYIKSVEFDCIEARAVCDGEVAFAGVTTAFGNTVVLDHGAGLFSLYGHLDSSDINSGQTMKKGDIVGNSSDSGMVMKGGELFFAFLQDGVFVNPFMLINEQRVESDSDTTSAPNIFD
jgi:hypothetical protein